MGGGGLIKYLESLYWCVCECAPQQPAGFLGVGMHNFICQLGKGLAMPGDGGGG